MGIIVAAAGGKISDSCAQINWQSKIGTPGFAKLQLFHDLYIRDLRIVTPHPYYFSKALKEMIKKELKLRRKR